MMPKGMLVVTPSRVTVGESFAICVKLRGDVHHVPCENAFCTVKPRQRGPFNLDVQRGIQYLDDTLAEWEGTLEVHGDGLSGPRQIVFDGLRQGVFEGDRRPIGRFGPFHFDRPGMHFVRLVDPRSGLVGLANAVHVTAKPPAERLWWGDPHWQTFFSDGIRCPEELYAFARDEAFLDFGAISDHMEAITDRQWDYFQAVTNDFNAPGRFATLIGQEWTHHLAEGGAPGHRNLYVRDDRAPAWRCTDSECNSLERLWRCLDELGPARVIAIAHHTANPVMEIGRAHV